MNGILKKDLRVVLTGVMIFISYQVYSNPESGTKEQGDVYRNLPFSMPEVSQPSFPDYEVNIRDFGALSDGVTLNGDKQCNQGGKLQRRGESYHTRRIMVDGARRTFE